jgi:pyrroloquinoline quinone biosynthesis protein B
MRARILGTAAGGGLPQWNCACAECVRAREAGTSAWRTQDCLAVDAGDGWYLVNASPDIRAQILATAELAAGPGRRQSPVRGVLLTDAELDHVLGLAALREGALDVYATVPVLGALDTGFPVTRLLAPYAGTRWHTVVAGEPLALTDRLSVTALPLGPKRPRYAADLPEAPDWVIAYRFEDTAAGGVLVYAPCVARWTAALDDACRGADCLILDGTFYTDGEMASAAGGGATARDMGHLPMSGPLGSLEYVRDQPRLRRIFTHLNNTNPASDPCCVAARAVAAAGAEIAWDGMLFVC